jgi:hypothetical protein
MIPIESSVRTVQNMSNNQYPEHEKVKEVSDRSNECGRFLDWLRNTKRAQILTYHSHTPSCYVLEDDEFGQPVPHLICGTDEDDLVTLGSTYDLLCEYFKIDRKAYEAEKEQMLEELRSGGLV